MLIQSRLSVRRFFDLRTFAEIAIVFAVMLSVKEIADNVDLIGAGSVVTKDVEPGVVCVGVPAVAVRQA